MGKLYVQYLAVYNNKNLTNGKKYLQKLVHIFVKY